MIRIWLDDVRPMKEGFTHWCKTPDEAIDILSQGNVKHISFDHDLGLPDPNNGNRVARYIELQAYVGLIPRLTWKIHSANPVGRKNIYDTMMNAEFYWDRKSNQ